MRTRFLRAHEAAARLLLSSEQVNSGRFARGAFRVAKIAALAILALAALWIVGANLFLALVFRRVAARPPDLQVDYDYAWTILPARVHAANLRITSHVDAVEWMIEARRAIVSFDLPSLLKKEVHMPEVEATDFRIRVRLPVDPLHADDPRLSALPPIADFRDPFVQVETVPAQPEASKTWTVRVDDARVDASEIWIQHARFEGDAVVRGGFAIHPLSFVAVRPLELRVKDGSLSFGAHEALRAIDAEVSGTIEGFEPIGSTPAAVLRNVSGQVRVRAQVPSIDFVEFFAAATPRKGAPFTLEDGSGELDVDASMLHGSVLDGSSIEYVTDRVRAVVRGFEVVARLHARGTKSGDALVAAVDAPIASLYRAGVSGPPIAIQGARASISSASADLGEPVAFGGASASVEAARSHDVRWFTRYEGASGDIALLGGEGEATARLTMDRRFVATGHAGALVRGLRAKIASATLDANVEAFSDVSVDLSRREIALDGASVVLSRGEVDTRGSRRPITAQATLSSARVDLRDGVEVRARATAAANDALAVLDLAQVKGLAEAVAGMIASDKAEATGDMIVRRGVAFFELQDAASGMGRAKGAVEIKDHHVDGAFLVRAGPASVGVELDDGGAHARPLAGDDWLASHRPAAPSATLPRPRAAR